MLPRSSLPRGDLNQPRSLGRLDQPADALRDAGSYEPPICVVLEHRYERRADREEALRGACRERCRASGAAAAGDDPSRMERIHLAKETRLSVATVSAALARRPIATR